MPTRPRAETALFAYMLADNDLELFALRDVNEMERGLSRSTNNARVRIIITNTGGVQVE